MARKLFIPTSQDGNYVEDDSEFGILRPVRAINAIRNPGFEAGGAFWASPGARMLAGPGRESLVSAYVPRNMGEGGENSLEQTFLSHMSQDLTVGKINYIYFWATTDVGTGTLELRISDSGNNTLVSKSYNPPSGEWQRYLVAFTPTTQVSRIELWRSDAAGSFRVDDVVCLDIPCDYYLTGPSGELVPLPTIRETDKADPTSLVYTARVRMLSEFGIRVTSVVGLGHDQPQVNAVQLSSGESRFVNSVPVAKDFSITGRIQGNAEQIDRYKADLAQELAHDPDNPKVLVYTRKRCGLDVGTAGIIIAAFKGGTGIERTQRNEENLSLDFSQLDPRVYFGARADILPISQALRGGLSGVPVSTISNRVIWRVKGEAWRDQATQAQIPSDLYSSGFDTSGQQRGYFIESGEGDVFMWGPWVNLYAPLLGATGGVHYIIRRSRNGLNSWYALTGGGTAGVLGAERLSNGDIIFYGQFVIPGGQNSLALYRQRTATLTTYAAVSVAAGIPRIESLRESFGRVFIVPNGELIINGTPVTTAANGLKTVISTTDHFRTWSVDFSGSSDNASAGEVHLRKAGESIFWVENFSVSLGGGTTRIHARMFFERAGFEPLSTGVAAGVPYKQVYATYGDVGTAAFGAAFVGAYETEESVAVVFDRTVGTGSSIIEFFPSGRVTGLNLGGSTIANTIQLWPPRLAVFPVSASAFTVNGTRYMGACEYQAGGKLIPLEAHYGHIGKYVDFAALPGQGLNLGPENAYTTHAQVVSENQGLVAPVLHFVGGFRDFRPVTIYNETNGSKLAFSGSLLPDQVSTFKTDATENPPGLILLENTGPRGYFELSPGNNVLLMKFSFRLDSDTLSRDNYLNVDGLNVLNFTERLITVTCTGSGANGVQISSGSVNLSNSIAGSTVPGWVSMAEANASGIVGHGYFANTGTFSHRLPMATIYAPKSALTIEAGTY